ncbi:DUF3427 domain-containing protein [Peribacillus frigoritolerans]|uniref:DUF3427 domain-containing protein n=1 Tax=Peribacillus frigoritolerans TaxID=450367 RepID=UPI002281F18A|nr:DUF3427 domain-containing protein [Peribacillus frigoritolerans]MCY9138063.1 DUF3427 domain-containing protein [Peribacillus frigoritolerans]
MSTEKSNISIKNTFIGMIIAIISLFAVGSFFTIFDDKIADFFLWLFQLESKKKVINKEWIGFWGNIFGSLIQGIVTAAGIFVSFLIFKEDKNNNEKKERAQIEREQERVKEQRKRDENDEFVKGFGKILSAYYSIIRLVDEYEDLNKYKEKKQFRELKELANIINDGEIILIISQIDEEILNHERFKEKESEDYSKDEAYRELNNKIRINMKYLKNNLEKEKKNHVKKLGELKKKDLSNFKLLEHVRKVFEVEEVLRELSSKLPLKRVYEFAIAKYLLDHDEISLETAKREILKLVKEVDEDSILHAFQCLNQDFYDPGQKKRSLKLFTLENGHLSKTSSYQKFLHNEEYRTNVEDLINNGILIYEKEFKEDYYGVPHLKLYEQYQMVDAALLSNYRKNHSAFRGSGLLSNGNDYFLFIDLHKEEEIKESINYQDQFINERIFQWQTPNSTAPSSERGKNIVFNQDRGIQLHLFIRKYKEIDGKTEPYIYIGKGNTVEYEGEKPITVTMELEHEVTAGLYTEFTKRV